MNAKISSLRIAKDILLGKATRAEYFAEWREHLVDFVSPETVDACTVAGRRELLPSASHSYVAFADPSGGSGSDSFTCAVAHFENEKAILEAYRETRPVFSPERATQEFCTFLKTYRISEVIGDAYAGSWPREQFQKHGIMYNQSPLTKSEIYLAFLPLLNSGAIELLDSERLRSQLCGLERKTSRGGRDSIDHQPNANAHDDVANACCAALRLAHCEAGGDFSLARLQSEGSMLGALEEQPPAVVTTFERDMFSCAAAQPSSRAVEFDNLPSCCPGCGGPVVLAQFGMDTLRS